jgi:multiple sugar transport system substrate-binding protein
MKTFFALTFLALLALSALAWRLLPAPVAHGRTVLVWASDDNPMRAEQIRRFNAAFPRRALQLDPNNTGLEKVVVQSLAGVGPDVFDVGEGHLSVCIGAGIAWDVTDALKRRGVDVQTDTWKSVQNLAVRDGRVYGVPSNAAANALLLNRELFEKAGIALPKGPWTWEQFLPIAQKLTVRDARGRAQQFGFICDWWLWPHFVLQWGGRVFSEDGTRCVIDSPEAIEGIQFLHDLIYKYRVMPSPVEEAAMATQGGWGSGTITQFGANKGAMALAGRWWLCTLRKKDQFPGLRLAACESPYPQEGRRVFYSYGRATLINKTSPRREEALDFLVYMMGADYNTLINEQADALAPVRRFAQSPAFLHNPQYPEETDNAVWRAALEAAEPSVTSRFVNAQAAQRILTKQLDLVKNDQKPVASALKTAAQQINALIQESIARDPALKARYDAAVKGAR